MSQPKICECGKAGYPSALDAKRSCRGMGNRFRVYTCHTGLYHVTKGVGSQGRGATGRLLKDGKGRREGKRVRFYEED